DFHIVEGNRLLTRLDRALLGQELPPNLVRVIYLFELVIVNGYLFSRRIGLLFPLILVNFQIGFALRIHKGPAYSGRDAQGNQQLDSSFIEYAWECWHVQGSQSF